MNTFELTNLEYRIENLERDNIRLEIQIVDLGRELSAEINELRKELELSRSHSHGYVPPPVYGGR